MARDTFGGSIRSFFGNALGGVRGRQNLASWVVAGTAAYYLWIKPEREALREEEAKARRLHHYVERVKPASDVQNHRKLIRGKRKEPAPAQPEQDQQ